MSPMDFILLIVSVGGAVMSVLAQGWSLNGIGPAILLIAVRHLSCCPAWLWPSSRC